MTDNKSSSLSRFRRWLGYKILPGTSESSVATTKRLAMHELSIQYEKTDGPTHHIVESYAHLKKYIPLRDAWNSEYDIEKLDDRFTTEDETQ